MRSLQYAGLVGKYVSVERLGKPWADEPAIVGMAGTVVKVMDTPDGAVEIVFDYGMSIRVEELHRWRVAITADSNWSHGPLFSDDEIDEMKS